MKFKKTIAILIGVLFFIINGCLPNRLPPEPVEQDRPLFLHLIQPDGVYLDDPTDSSAVLNAKLTSAMGFPIPRNIDIILGFNELMDPGTFDGNVFLTCCGDTIGGTFENVPSPYNFGDTLVYGVRFRPSHPLDPLTSYVLTILGGVKDTAGNSMSIEPGFVIAYEFSTTGECPLPRVLIGDRTNGQVIAIDTFSNWQFTNILSLPTGFISYSNGQIIVITDEANSSGFVKFFNPDGSVLDSVQVGGRQNGISIYNGKFVITTKSPRAYVVLDATTRSVVDSGALSITPKRAAINDDYIYVLSTLRSIVAINRHTGSTTVFSNTLVAPLRSPNMATDSLTGKVAINDYNGNRVLLITGIDTSYIDVQGYHPTDVSFLNSDTLLVATYEGKILSLDLSNGNITEYTLPDAITSISTFGDYIYAYLPNLSIGNQSGFLVIVNKRGEIIRGINVGGTGSEIFLTEMTQ